MTKTELKKWIKENWISVLLLILLGVITLNLGCGSTWEIKGNNFEILKNQCKNDSIKNEVQPISPTPME